VVRAPVALLFALTEEAASLSKHLDAGVGELEGIPVVLAVTGVGKVNAAMATTLVVHRYRPSGILVMGLAGAAHDGEPGQVIVASGAVQYDFDARPLTSAKGELPGYSGRALLAADRRLTKALHDAVPEARLGVVLTGDQIVTSREVRDRIVSEFPDGACFDMETGAVAQVALSIGVPWAGLRITSDAADESFNLDDVLGFGAGTAAELFERIFRRAAGSLLRSS
jgi:adenosylhomocysteine nucleosidase